jgi:hypothetical protein
VDTEECDSKAKNQRAVVACSLIQARAKIAGTTVGFLALSHTDPISSVSSAVQVFCLIKQ